MHSDVYVRVEAGFIAERRMSGDAAPAPFNGTVQRRRRTIIMAECTPTYTSE